ncbi:MAG: hypothetical protein A2X08_15845 [Bacteroidetes bacterium GWA2_32_17]|nr:MAG: hypothetical protein A2X08_15845 [Bacteroidetes bacterium GWA2_32_17]
MIQIDDKIVSSDIFEKMFLCNIIACKGSCCVAGDSGAPIEPDEILAIKEALPSIYCLLSEQSIQTIEKNGVAAIDSDGDLVTVLNNDKECAFVIFENGIAACAIEKSFEKGKCKIPKPVSCHLYPIRLKKYSTFTTVNYDQWDICKHAIENGKNSGVPIYKFAKNALIRKFGKKWYDELCVAANYVLNEIMLNDNIL